MAARPSTFGNMVLALTLICLVCAGLLGLVQHVTAERIERTNQEKENKAIAQVVPGFSDETASENPVIEKTEVGESIVFTARKREEIVGYAVKVRTGGFGGPLVMMVGFTPDGTIHNTSVISHSETPGLGAKITDPSCPPRTQVIGKNPATTVMDAKKYRGDIDAITASTITSRAFLKGVSIAHEVFRSLNPIQEEPVQNPENNEQQPQ